MEVLTFVPSKTILLISGLEVKGWNKISITRNAPAFIQIRGIRGKNTRTRVKDSSATVSIECHQTEILHDVLSKCLEADIAAGNVRLEVMLKEVAGNSFFNTTTAYITGFPEISFSDTLGTVTWTLACDESSFHIGGARNAAVGIVQDGVARLKDFVSDIVN